MLCLSNLVPYFSYTVGLLRRQGVREVGEVGEVGEVEEVGEVGGQGRIFFHITNYQLPITYYLLPITYYLFCSIAMLLQFTS